MAGQSILSLIAELKRDALLSDFPALNRLVAEKREAHKLLQEQSARQIQECLQASTVQVSRQYQYDD